MRSKWIIAAAGIMACTATTKLSAQGGVALIPFAGYAIPGMLAEDDQGNEMKMQSAMLLGLQLELGLSKNLGIDVGLNKTFSQTLEVGGPAFGGTTEVDISMMQVTGSLVIRPGGRRPNGGVTPLLLELGGGVTMYQFGSAAASFDDFDATKPMFFAGLGYNVPIGPRGTLQFFARGQMITAYESTGLDDLNAIPPATTIEGKSMINIQAGVGFRFGR